MSLKVALARAKVLLVLVQLTGTRTAQARNVIGTNNLSLHTLEYYSQRRILNNKENSKAAGFR